MSAWIPLESNPEVMTKFLHKCGVPKKWELVDVYGLEPELLAMIPRPALALILLYPINPLQEDFKSEMEKKEKENSISNDKVYHLRQFVSNACGTVALLHCVGNKLDQLKLEDGELRKFLEETKDLDSTERGHKLVEASAISETHKDFALEGQTDAPSENEKLVHHFVAFVERDGSIYELDGRKPYPINHGSSSAETFVDDAARLCREYMSRDPEEVRFTVMAFVAAE